MCEQRHEKSEVYCCIRGDWGSSYLVESESINFARMRRLMVITVHDEKREVQRFVEIYLKLPSDLSVLLLSETRHSDRCFNKYSPIHLRERLGLLPWMCAVNKSE